MAQKKTTPRPVKPLPPVDCPDCPTTHDGVAGYRVCPVCGTLSVVVAYSPM